MPLSEKFSLVENLWEHFGPSSRKVLRIGLDAPVDLVVQAVSDHVDSTVANYRIPDNLEKRFSWLSAGDVDVKQQLLNYFRQKEKALAVERARAVMACVCLHPGFEVGIAALPTQIPRLKYRQSQVGELGLARLRDRRF